MTIESTTIGYVGMTVSILVLVLMVIPHILWWRRIGTAKESSGAIYPILAGLMLLLLECSYALVDGRVWYRELFPLSWSNPNGKISFSGSLLAYVLIVFGVIVSRLRKPAREGTTGQRG